MKAIKHLFLFIIILGSLEVSAQALRHKNGTKFYDLEEALTQPDSVVYLDLAMQENKLTTIPKEVLLFPNLEYLDVSFNRISSLPNGLKELKKLKSIDLSGNRYLSKFPEVLKELPSLQVVNFSDIPEWSKEKCDAAKAALPGVTVITDK